MSADKTLQPLTKAVLWMSVALMSFTLMAVAVRELSAEIHPFQMVFIRSGVGLMVITAVIAATGWATVRTQRLPAHLFRNIVHIVGQTLWIFGITLLPLATVFAIEFTTPLWAALLAVLFLGERMNRGRWTALILGIAGIAVILQPGFGGGEAGLITMIFCAVFFGISVTATKWLTRTEHPLTILFFMMLIQTGLGCAASLFVWTPVALEHWPWLIIMGITGLSAHYAMVRAFGHADATIVVPMDFLRLPLIIVVGFLLYAESLQLATLIGAALIFGGNYYSIVRESRTARGR